MEKEPERNWHWSYIRSTCGVKKSSGPNVPKGLRRGDSNWWYHDGNQFILQCLKGKAKQCWHNEDDPCWPCPRSGWSGRESLKLMMSSNSDSCWRKCLIFLLLAFLQGWHWGRFSNGAWLLRDGSIFTWPYLLLSFCTAGVDVSPWVNWITANLTDIGAVVETILGTLKATFIKVALRWVTLFFLAYFENLAQ